MAPLCLTLCDPVDCSPSGSSVHEILQARILERVTFRSPGDLLNPGIKPGSPALQAESLPSEPPGKPRILIEVSYHISFRIVIKNYFLMHDAKFRVARSKSTIFTALSRVKVYT